MPFLSLAEATCSHCLSVPLKQDGQWLDSIESVNESDKSPCASCQSAGVQVFPEVNKAMLLRAFEQYGRITGHTFLHNSDCAFIDFESEREAAAAKEALEGAPFDGHRIRIEFKDTARGPPRGGGRRGPPPPGLEGKSPTAPAPFRRLRVPAL